MEWSKEDGESLVDPTFPETNSSHLKIDGWKMKSRWWFQRLFIFNSWGNDPNLTDIFQVG